MSYKVDGTKVRTLSTLLGRVLHIAGGAFGGSRIKGTIMKMNGYENEVSVATLIGQKRANKKKIDTGVVSNAEAKSNANQEKGSVA